MEKRINIDYKISQLPLNRKIEYSNNKYNIKNNIKT